MKWIQSVTVWKRHNFALFLNVALVCLFNSNSCSSLVTEKDEKGADFGFGRTDFRLNEIMSARVLLTWAR
jgi:hypothetical protein